MSKLHPKEFNRLVSRIREGFSWSDLHKQVLLKARRDAYNRSYCHACDSLIGTTDTAKDVDFYDKMKVDHIEPVGTLRRSDGLDNAVNLIYCDISNLQAICSFCHDFKTCFDKQQIAETKLTLREILDEVA